MCKENSSSEDALKRQSQIIKNVSNAVHGQVPDIKNSKLLINRRTKNFDVCRRGTFSMKNKETKDQETPSPSTEGTGVKILTTKLIPDKLLIALSQLKTGNTSKTLLNIKKWKPYL